jgi:Ras-related protein Rab-28
MDKGGEGEYILESDDEDGAPEVHRFKVILLGDGAVGKTSIILRFAQDYFAQSYKQTIGVDFFMKRIQLPGNIEVNLQVWDIGGQQLGSRMLKNYINGSDAVLLTYDISSHDSFRNLEDWMGFVSRTFREKDRALPVLGLVANKSDLAHAREVSRDRHTRFGLELGMHSFEVSAKNGANVNQMFYKMAADLANVPISKTELDVRGKVVKAEIVNHPLVDERTEEIARVGHDKRSAEKEKGKKKKKGCAIQ